MTILAVLSFLIPTTKILLNLKKKYLRLMLILYILGSFKQKQELLSRKNLSNNSIFHNSITFTRPVEGFIITRLSLWQSVEVDYLAFDNLCETSAQLAMLKMFFT